MTGQEKVMGIVLSAAPFGDYDKRLVLLTKDRGKITVFAKGARRPASQFLGCSQPFVFGTFTVYQGRNAYTLVQAEITNYFSELREDGEGIYYAFYFCEFAQYIVQENMDAKQVLKLVYQSFRALIEKPVSLALIRVIFELKLMDIDGQAPLMFSCVKCGRKGNFNMLSISRGGVVCQECGDKKEDVHIISDGCRYTMQYIISSTVEKVYTFNVTDEILCELREIMKEFLGKYVEHDFKSLDMLEFMCGDIM